MSDDLQADEIRQDGAENCLAALIAADRAVRGRVFPHGSTPLGGMDWCKPSLSEGEVRVKLQSIDSSVRAYWVTAEQYRELRKRPYSHVGMWAFAPEDDPATRLIAAAHSSPESVARQLHRAREENQRLQDFVAWVDTWISNPIGAYSTSALDGLFGMTRDRIAALTRPERTGEKS